MDVPRSDLIMLTTREKGRSIAWSFRVRDGIARLTLYAAHKHRGGCYRDLERFWQEGHPNAPAVPDDVRARLERHVGQPVEIMQ